LGDSLSKKLLLIATLFSVAGVVSFWINVAGIKILRHHAAALYLEGMGFLWGLYLFAQSFTVLWKEQVLKGLPRSKTHSLAPGQVAQSGRARCGAPLMAPLSGKPCAYYEYTIDVVVKSRNNNVRVPFQAL
jgi:hypothetical protein